MFSLQVPIYHRCGVCPTSVWTWKKFSVHFFNLWKFEVLFLDKSFKLFQDFICNYEGIVIFNRTDSSLKVHGLSLDKNFIRLFKALILYFVGIIICNMTDTLKNWPLLPSKHIPSTAWNTVNLYLIFASCFCWKRELKLGMTILLYVIDLIAVYLCQIWRKIWEMVISVRCVPT